VVVPPLPFVAVGVGDAVGVGLVVGGDIGDAPTLGGVDPDAVAVTLPRGGASAELPHPASVTTAAQARAANVRRARVGLRIVVLASSDTHSGAGPEAINDACHGSTSPIRAMHFGPRLDPSAVVVG